MKSAYRELLIVVICLLLGFAISRTLLHYFPSYGERRIDCSIAEFSPDFTPEMRKACRDARLTNIK